MADLNSACMTLALQVISIFVSSFPGFIIIGNIQQETYQKGNFFKFGIFELHKLYSTIVEVLKYFTNVNLEHSGPKQFHQNEENEENYFWSGHSVLKLGESLKIVSLGIEKEGIVTYELKLYLKEFQNLFFCLQKVIISSLCLNLNEYKLIKYCSEQNIETLKCIQNEISREKEIQTNKYLNDFVGSFMKKHNINTIVCVSGYTEIIKYYFEIIIILQKLKSLEIVEETNRDEIIKNII
jgi:hypothetical protein